MPVNWNQFIPDNLRQCWKAPSGDLKASCTTAAYTGGNPSGPQDLKRSIVDASGNLKQGLTDGADLDLKASMKPALSQQPPSGGTLITMTIGNFATSFFGFGQTYGVIDPTSFDGVAIERLNAGATTAQLRMGDGTVQIPGVTTVRGVWTGPGETIDYQWNGTYYSATNSTLFTWLSTRVGQQTTVTLEAL